MPFRNTQVLQHAARVRSSRNMIEHEKAPGYDWTWTKLKYPSKEGNLRSDAYIIARYSRVTPAEVDMERVVS